MPITHANLWDEITSWDNLLAAYREARRGKRYRRDALRFTVRLEELLIDIQNRLIWREWTPGRWREFQVIDPKPRLIQAPPFADRVVHHALVRVLEPLFERRYIHDSYACRRGKGPQAAVARLQGFLRAAQRRRGEVYVLQADISRYFASIPHDRLLAVLARAVADRDALWLCERIIRASADGRGIPVGALTSQLFANAYLDQLDHFIKDDLGERHYLRYMDDFVVLGPSKAGLRERLDGIADFLAGELGLRLNPKTAIYPARRGVDFCGYRTWSTHVLPRRRNVQRARRRLRALARRYAAGKASLADVRASAHSFLGYMKHCAGRTTVEGVMGDMVLVRGEEGDN